MATEAVQRTERVAGTVRREEVRVEAGVTDPADRDAAPDSTRWLGTHAERRRGRPIPARLRSPR